VPPRSKIPGVPDDNRTFARLTKVEDRVDVAEHRLDEHERELDALNLDIRDLADIVLRSHRRARARLMARRRMARRRSSSDR
jgi:hypothetical protein